MGTDFEDPVAQNTWRREASARLRGIAKRIATGEAMPLILLKVKAYSPMSRKLVAEIWSKAHLLRVGNPDAGPPSEDDRSGTNFRKPQTAVFALLILELGLGLRRNEADKARWDWIFEAADGRRYFEVREATDFKPKSRQSGIIPVADEVWEALKTLKEDNSVFIVTGPPAAKPSKKIQRTYRCKDSHEALVFWLKKAGVTHSIGVHE